MTWPAIDYSDPQHWLAWPGRPSAASQTPREGDFQDREASAVADVFYIHPTTNLRADLRNAPLDDPKADRISGLMLLTQATPFNAVGRIFAPKYRQITLPTYDLPQQDYQEPHNRAYADVRDAFDYYVVHENHGRPFFLVGHSQGSSHGLRLLSDRIQGTPLASQLVAAYLPGQSAPLSLFQDDLTGIPPCTQPEQTGCVAVWGTFGEGATADLGAWETGNPYWHRSRQWWAGTQGQPLVNINPVSWSKSLPITSMRQHQGAVPFGTQATFARVLPHLVAVRDDGRYTYVSPVPLPADEFNAGGLFGGMNYHVFDIALFWLDIRSNARLRLDAWLSRQGAVSGK